MSNRLLLCALILLCMGVSSSVWARNNHKKRAATQEAAISFSFENEPLVSIINYVADKKEVNVILPQGGNKIEAKVTWHLDYKISLDQAWNLLHTLLDTAGYILLPELNFYRVVPKNKDTVSHLPATTYIGVAPIDLPDSDEIIHYVHYLANIKVAEGGDDELSRVLKEILPVQTTFQVDAATNALILMGKSSDIKAALEIIRRLDMDQEKMDILRLRFADAKTVANLFNQNILGNEVNRYRLDAQKQNKTTYFSQHMKVFAYDRLNALIVVGKETAVARLKQFVLQYIDVEQGSGKSILHVYQLQYLDATKFSDVLRNVINASRPGGAEQAGANGTAPVVGSERYFDEVRITVDRPPEEAEPVAGKEGREKTPYYGGNKLIIAARNDDWKRIKKLIEELDTPSPQVYIEVLIADLTVADQKLLGSIVRNPAKLPMPGESNFQSSQFTPGIIPSTFTDPQTIGVIESPSKVAADLLRLGFNTDGSRNDAGGTSAASFAAPGSTVISLNDNDGATWGILKVLKLFDHNKILSHPHIIAKNNKPAMLNVMEERLVAGSASGNLGNTIVKNDWINASLKVTLTPRISPGNIVNLFVEVDIQEFLPGGSNARITRTIITEANVNDSDVLALGGLIKLNNTRANRKTPVLGDIPVFGWLFKNRESRDAKTNLTVFISPTIIQPRLREGASELTRSYLDVARSYSQEQNLFEGLRDPITRWYFQPDYDVELLVENFIEKDVLKEDAAYNAGAPDESDRISAGKPRNNRRNRNNRRQVLTDTPCSADARLDEREKSLKEMIKGEKNPFTDFPPPAA